MCALVAANGLLSPGFPLAAEFPFSLCLVLATLASDPGHRVLTQTYFFSAFDGNLNTHSILSTSLPTDCLSIA